MHRVRAGCFHYIHVFLYVSKVSPKTRHIVIVENIRLVHLQELTADFRVKMNAKLMPIFKLLREKSKTGFQSCLYTVTLTPFFA